MISPQPCRTLVINLKSAYWSIKRSFEGLGREERCFTSWAFCGNFSRAHWDGAALLLHLSRHKSKEVKLGDEQCLSVTNPLLLCVWHGACSSLAGHWEEERCLQCVAKLGRLWRADFKRFQPSPGQRRRAAQGDVLCSAAKSLLYAVPWGLQLQKLLSQLAWTKGRCIDRAVTRRWASKTFLPARASLSSAHQYTTSPEKRIYSALSDFSEAVVWPVIYRVWAARESHLTGMLHAVSQVFCMYQPW